MSVKMRLRYYFTVSWGVVVITSLYTEAMKLCGIVIVLFAALQFPETVKSASKKQASVGCTLGTNLTLTFFLDVGSSNLGQVFLVNATNMADTTLNTFSTLTGDITGNGSRADPFQFSIVAEVDRSKPSAFITLPSESVYNKAYIQDSVILTVNVMAKSNESLDGTPFLQDVIFPDDITFIATCDLDSLQASLVSTGQINTTGVVEEAPESTSQRITMEIITSAGVQTSNVQLGQKIQLEMVAPVPTDIKGFFPYSCFSCDLPDCSGSEKHELIDSSGCSTGYVAGFTDNAPLKKHSGVFLAYKFLSQDFMFFQCRVSLCYSLNDTTCSAPPTCGISGRKKRSVDEPTEEEITIASTFLKIELNAEDFDITLLDGKSGFENSVQQEQADAAKQQELVSTALIGSVIALAALLTIGTVAAIVIFWRLTRRKATSG